MADPTPPATPDERELDLVLFGATGFTGELTAQYLAEHAPDGLRWALAGRSADKLARVRSRLAKDFPSVADVELCVADSHDAEALAALAARTRLVITTVGPYLEYGEPLVAACANAGTDYVDLTGEPEFVDRMWLDHHETAQRTGARIVHACGFDSIPHDLGAFFTIRQLAPKPEDEVTMTAVVRAGGMASAGTLRSAINAFSRGKQMRAAMKERKAREPRPTGRSSRAVAGKPHKDEDLGYYLVPLPTIDPIIVARSGAADASYGRRFSYSHYAGTRTLRYAAGGAGGVGAVLLAAQVKPLRDRLLKRIKSGDGPDEARREKAWFTVRFRARAGGRVVHTKVSGGDPGYTETSKMLSESALCLLFDDNPQTSGQVTTAQAMGENLLVRLQRAGIRFEEE